MSFRVDQEDQLVLLNVKHQGLHLWSLEDKCLIRKYQGPQQDNYVIHSCFGGIGQNFIASGSEGLYTIIASATKNHYYPCSYNVLYPNAESKVYIWHWKREKPIAVLQGHSRTVNCVDWNPSRPDMIVSTSDDHTIRVWGPNPEPSHSSKSNGTSK